MKFHVIFVFSDLIVRQIFPRETLQILLMWCFRLRADGFFYDSHAAAERRLSDSGIGDWKTEHWASAEEKNSQTTTTAQHTAPTTTQWHGLEKWKQENRRKIASSRQRLLVIMRFYSRMHTDTVVPVCVGFIEQIFNPHHIYHFAFLI